MSSISYNALYDLLCQVIVSDLLDWPARMVARSVGARPSEHLIPPKEPRLTLRMKINHHHREELAIDPRNQVLAPVDMLFRE